MSASTPTPTPSQLWLVDRTRREDHHRCQMLRYLRWHYGPYGVGMNRRAKSVPLATGGALHAGLQPVLEVARDHDRLPTPEELDRAVAAGLADYQTTIDSRGLDYWASAEDGWDGDTRIRRLIDEQQLLIEGLIRAWTLWQLPEVLRTMRVCFVEEEHVAVVGCTCGLGDLLGTQADHDARGCTGIGVQCRVDFVTQHRTSGLYAYHEFKSTSEANVRWQKKWDTDMQPFLGTLGVEVGRGIQVEEIYIHGLIKGRRDREYQNGSYTGPEYQNSPLVYAYFNTREPEAQEWAVRYKWTDADGKNRNLPKYFDKTTLRQWMREAPYQLYLETFAEDLRGKVLYTHGPLLRKDGVRADALESWIALEQQWRAAVWELQDAAEAAEGRLDHPEFRAALNRLAPKSFACQPYGPNYACPMIPLCHHHPGWENPELHDFIPRRPHHQPELDQLRARGFEPPSEATEATFDEE